MCIDQWLIQGCCEFWNLYEVQYSKLEAFTSIEEAKSNTCTMLGPDLFHLRDQNQKLRLNIWIPIHLPGKLEIDYLYENEGTIFTTLYDANTYCGKVWYSIRDYFKAQSCSYTFYNVQWNLISSSDDEDNEDNHEAYTEQ